MPEARGDLPPLIPRKILFGNPARAIPRLSPDGSLLAYLAPSPKGVSNLWVQTPGTDDARMVTDDRRQGIIVYSWSADGKHLLYRQDQNGDENWHVFSIDLASKQIRDLTPFVGVRAKELFTSPKRPNEILVGLNIRNRQISEMYRIDLTTGGVTLDTENPGDVIGWATDQDFIIRAATTFDGETARSAIRVRDSQSAPWREIMSIPFEDCSFYGQVNGGTLVVGFAPGGKSLYVVSPLGADKTRLVEVDGASGKELNVVALDPRSDVEYNAGLILARPDVLTDPQSGRVQAVAFNYTKLEWKVTDPSLAADFETLEHARPGTLAILDRVRDDSLWLVDYSAPDSVTTFCLYDRKNKKLTDLFVDQPELAGYKLAPCEPVVIKSRDGLDLVSYLTLPVGLPKKDLPLVLYPHGGPWWRDRWTYDPWAQLLANRGYAVLQVQYRGSTGFGKAFLNASNRQFGDQAVLADVLDGVKWAVDTGLADPKRLCVLGASGGGYATLCCIAFHPELNWRCAVDMVGPSSVKTLLESFPPYWKPVKRRWVLRMGDAENDEAWNHKISPLYHADKIRAPLLMGYGLNDVRVTIREAEQMFKSMQENHQPVTLVIYPDEGHGFVRPENNLDFFGRMEDFLAKYLGGRKEAYSTVPGSSGRVRESNGPAS
jgi:dipeptidyl aminopeptidase/acylaminoacyl peptidase